MTTNQNYNKAVAVTPSDTADLAEFASNAKRLTHALYVGSNAGNVVAVLEDNTTVTFKLIPVGTLLPIRVRRINATSTTSTDLVALYQV